MTSSSNYSSSPADNFASGSVIGNNHQHKNNVINNDNNNYNSNNSSDSKIDITQCEQLHIPMKSPHLLFDPTTIIGTASNNSNNRHPYPDQYHNANLVINSNSDPNNHNNRHLFKFNTSEGVKEPLPTDVICGRGKMTASHPANRRFRQLVDSHKVVYQNSKRRDEKTRVTCDLVDKLRNEGRFVLFDPITKLWHEVSEEYAKEKVSHSLRSRSSSERMNSSTTTTTQTIVNYINNSNNSNNNNEANRINKHRVNINTVSATSAAIPVEMLNSSTNTASTFKTRNTKTNIVKQEATMTASTTTTINHKKKDDNDNINNNNKPIVFHGVSTVSKHQHSRHRNTSAKQQQHYLGPEHDEIVRRLIGDQQALLRTMIQNETERVLSSEVFFCNSSGSGPPLLLSTSSRTAATVRTISQNIPQTTATAVTPSNTPLSTTTANTNATSSTPATTITARSVTAV